MSKKKESPWASDAERAAVVVPDTRTPAEKRLHQLIEAESVPELCGADYSQALYKAALKMTEAQQPTGQAPCARHCEANAFRITIRGLKGDIERLKAAQPVPVQSVLVRDAAEVLGVSVQEVCAALLKQDRQTQRSTNMAISGPELLAVAAAIKATLPPTQDNQNHGDI